MLAGSGGPGGGGAATPRAPSVGYSSHNALYASHSSPIRDQNPNPCKCLAPSEPLETLSHLVKNLWAEAWKSADAAHEPEREKFGRERAEHEKARQEMAAEIRRLEEELERVTAEGETCQASLRKRKEELDAARVEQAQATQTAALLQAKVERLRAEGQKALENLTAWVERATKAETKLEALEQAKTNLAGRRDE